MKELHLYSKDGQIGMLSLEDQGWRATPENMISLVEQARHKLMTKHHSEPSDEAIFEQLNGQGSPYLVIRDVPMSPAEHRALFRQVNHDDLDLSEPRPEWRR